MTEQEPNDLEKAIDACHQSYINRLVPVMNKYEELGRVEYALDAAGSPLFYKDICILHPNENLVHGKWGFMATYYCNDEYHPHEDDWDVAIDADRLTDEKYIQETVHQGWIDAGYGKKCEATWTSGGKWFETQVKKEVVRRLAQLREAVDSRRDSWKSGISLTDVYSILDGEYFYHTDEEIAEMKAIVKKNSTGEPKTNESRPPR